MFDNGELEDKPPAPPVRMRSALFYPGGKDQLSANHSLKPLPSVPEERKHRNKIISIFASTERGKIPLFSKVTTCVPLLFLEVLVVL